jgi:heat shock protein HtpX
MTVTALIIGGAVVAATGGAGLLVARAIYVARLRRSGARAGLMDGLVFALAVLLASSTAMVAFLSSLAGFRQLAGSAPAFIRGAWVGLGTFALRWSLSAAVYLYRWSTERPLELYERRFLVRQIVVELLGLPLIGAIGIAVATELKVSARWHLLVPSALVALYPAFDGLVRPWLLFARANWMGGSEDRESAQAAKRWLADTAARMGLHGCRLVVLPGDVLNACAVGVLPPGRWIAVGEGLLKRMDLQTVSAVIAHELAHLVRRDTLKLLAVAVLCAAAYASLLPHVFDLWNRGRLLTGAVLATAAGAVLLALIPGWISRRIEFQTDRAAVRLLGDPEALCVALTRMAELKGEPLDREYVTHPSVQRRIAAIRAAAA